MTKGYWIARVDVRDAEAYKEYVAMNGAASRWVGVDGLSRWPPRAAFK